MSKERGWWKITYTVEPDEIDLEHIAELIKDGYTEGEIAITETDSHASA